MTRPTVCLSFDFDAISLWIGPMGAKSPSMISRGEFGAVAVPRILKILDREGIPATFFVTGHTAETYPEQTRAIAAAGHEIGHHGYLHENPIDLSPEDEERVMVRGLDALDSVTGVRPVGYRSPSWDNSPHTIDLLLKYGFRYESSLMARRLHALLVPHRRRYRPERSVSVRADRSILSRCRFPGCWTTFPISNTSACQPGCRPDSRRHRRWKKSGGMSSISWCARFPMGSLP